MSLDQYSFQDIVSLIGCYTNIKTDDDKEYNGYLYTIDPQTRHVVLYDNHHLQVIFHSTIKTINCKLMIISIYLSIYIFMSIKLIDNVSWIVLSWIML
ncbi:hypothetical protein BCV72DRAFT_120289 [Rhizopus microsporus var. microsporus]|uniref:Uncharacterized protein n=1 Tax=Rhizopus microsporus var. microsporus TaxID=86635 RepID=A0A1X0R3M1_RHIZD|nr:hypothetical protein BCV72DRAFT_120289 [Rhizopus microsporus var. microsporus]